MRACFKVFMLSGLILTVSAIGWTADHPASNSECAQCHRATSAGDAPKVVPEEPGFFAKLFLGKADYIGHKEISCVGSATDDGVVNGCHDPDKNFPNKLAIDLTGKPVDVLCGSCHASQREFGMHHPSYKVDKDGDGVGDSLVRPASVQEIFTTASVSAQVEPIKSYPDALHFITDGEGKRRIVAAQPLWSVVEIVEEKEVVFDDVVVCSTCHNPHFGFLVEVGKEEDMRADLVARPNGDALLRKRDHDNSLCLDCH
jgi:hypothetical protein